MCCTEVERTLEDGTKVNKSWIKWKNWVWDVCVFVFGFLNLNWFLNIPFFQRSLFFLFPFWLLNKIICEIICKNISCWLIIPADSSSGWELCIWTSLSFLSYQMLIVFSNYVSERIFIMALWFHVLRSVWNGVAMRSQIACHISGFLSRWPHAHFIIFFFLSS